MAGGPLPGEESLYAEVKAAAASRANVTFHGPLPYGEANELYGRAKLLLNTSDVEGFPNSYLQAWVRGVPVVTFIDPDRVIEREGLGDVARSPAELGGLIASLLGDRAARKAAADRCRRFMAREFAEDKILSAYLDTFQRATHAEPPECSVIPSSESPHA